MPFREEQNITEMPPKSSRNRWLDLLMAVTIGFFLITSATGVLLLCGVGKGIVMEAHKWLSLGLVVAGLIHAIRHGSPILRYARSVTFWGATAVVLVLTSAFVVPALHGGGRPGGHGGGMGAVFRTLEEAPLASLAGLTNTSADALVAQLREAGVAVLGPEQTLREIAQNSGKNPQELIILVFSNPKPDR